MSRQLNRAQISGDPLLGARKTKMRSQLHYLYISDTNGRGSAIQGELKIKSTSC